MKSKAIIFLGLIVAAASCSEKGPQTPQSNGTISLEPVITRALNKNFKQGNEIGLYITLSGGEQYSQNARLSYADGLFSSPLEWYTQGAISSSLLAYYPYSAEGFPEKFTIESDQSKGTDASDFMTAFKSDVYPGTKPEMMLFHHHFAQIVVNITNETVALVTGVSVKNLIPTALVSCSKDGEVSVEPDTSVEPTSIAAERVGEGSTFCVVLVPQAFENICIELQLEKGDAIHALLTSVDENELKSGYSYNVNVSLTAEKLAAAFGGSIADWQDGGNIGGGDVTPDEPPFEEGEGYFIYHGDRYTTALMKDGKTWMTQNMRCIPSGLTPSSDLTAVTAGIFNPVKVNSSHDGVEFTTDPAIIESNGYLYQSEIALGLNVGDLVSEEQAVALDGTQGLCPQGWRVPTLNDILGLVGKVGGYTGDVNTEAPYYDASKGNSSIALLNADGFNATGWGAVTILDNTKTSGSLMGWLRGLPDQVSSGYLCGSTFKQVSKDADTGAIKNFQFWSFMPMATNGTFNGAAISYRIAAPLRCVKD